MISTSDSHFTTRMEQVVVRAMEEVLGRKEVDAVLDEVRFPDDMTKVHSSKQPQKFPFEQIGRVQKALEDAYGYRAGGGLSMRVGRACLKYSLREFGSEFGMTDLEFRLLPLPNRLKVGSEALAKFFNTFTDQHVHLDIDEKHISWHIENCPLCQGRQSGGPCCSLALGFMQEALYWVSGGKNFMIEEKNCMACGDSTCTIEINRGPMMV